MFSIAPELLSPVKSNSEAASNHFSFDVVAPSVMLAVRKCMATANVGWMLVAGRSTPPVAAP
jgi:hypothetical protein